ncbi:MAG TPA: MFS transporter [Phycisphaerae bacterium]|nr:MFS transporter [Phycisphaerae bacterium]
MKTLGSMHRWRDWLGLNSSTLALLATILLVTASTELWGPLIPEYLNALQSRALAGSAATILLIGAYGFYRDALEAVNYYIGGAVSGRFNTRRSLLVFNVLPFVGLAVLLVWDAWIAVFVAIPFIFVWDSISGPAVITVVGDSLPPDRRTMAFSLQAICRRASRIFAYCLSAPLVWHLGRINGVRANAAIAIVFVLTAVGLQYRFMRTASRDTVAAIHEPRKLLRRFDPQLKRLLAADICARWAEGLAGPFIILFCVPILATDLSEGTALYASVLLTIQAATNIVLYVVVGPLASREGLAKKPYIGLTFLFFALFPLSLAVLGRPLGLIGLAAAFVIGGLREIGEPARKAMIADLVPGDAKTQAIGLYWSARSVAVLWASPVGAVLWLLGDRVRPGSGPLLTFTAAAVVGLIGAIVFFARFGRGATDRQSPNKTGQQPE